MLVRFGFGFISLKLKKPNQTQTGKNRAKTKPNRKKPSQTESNQFEPVFVLKNRTEPKPVGLNRFRFFLNFFSLVIFF
jgi:hypothetical protein